MPLPLAVLVMLLLLGAMAGYVVLARRAFRWLRRALERRGYKSPAGLALAGASAFVVVFPLTLLATPLVGRDRALWVALAAFPLVPAAGALGARLLPVRNPRTAGQRVVRFPYRGAGIALLVAAVLAPGAALVGASTPPQISVLLALAGLASLGIARRTSAPALPEVLRADPRAPVLYLRPFRDETTTFAECPRRARDLPGDWLRARTGRGGGRFRTAEEYLGREIEAAIGPLVALGNPLDFVPPEGAARVYLADEAWRDGFRELVERAACVVMIAAASDQVAWELGHLRAAGRHRRLYVLTRPRPPAPPRSWVRRGLHAWAGLLTRPSGRRAAPPAPWSAFAATLRAAGYRPDGPDPGPGAVIAFDEQGRARVLVRDAASAGEIVDAIRRHLGLAPARDPGLAAAVTAP
jgi:hypothetical protein